MKRREAFFYAIFMTLGIHYLIHTLLPESTYIFYGAAERPHCVDDMEDLPIRKIKSIFANTVYTGTAFLIGPDTWITAAHVVEHNPLDITLASGREKTRLELSYFDRENDVAILSGDDFNLPSLAMDYTYPEIGQTVWNIGYANEAAGKKLVTTGTVYQNVDTKIFMLALASSGMSGGPTIVCVGDTPTVRGVISSFVAYVDEDEEGNVRNTFNSGQSFSAKMESLNVYLGG